jgi:hypothetical protein
MGESNELGMARDHLARAEAALMTADGLTHLKEGLALLECVIDREDRTGSGSVAGNLGRTYTSRIYARIGSAMKQDPNLTQPALEHLFAVVRALDDTGFELPPNSRELKIDVVRRLIDYYYEGHSPAEKERAYRQLADISSDRDDD